MASPELLDLRQTEEEPTPAVLAGSLVLGSRVKVDILVHPDDYIEGEVESDFFKAIVVSVPKPYSREAVGLRPRPGTRTSLILDPEGRNSHFVITEAEIATPGAPVQAVPIPPRYKSPEPRKKFLSVDLSGPDASEPLWVAVISEEILRENASTLNLILPSIEPISID